MTDNGDMTLSPADTVLDLVPDNGVLGLGEPTHGSANAFAWKMNLLLELARRRRLSAFAMEESYALGLQVDDALRGGGDLDAAWDEAASVWKTPVIRAGLRALQKLNRTVPPERRISFLGIDVRKPHLAAQALLERGQDGPPLRDLADRTPLDEASRRELVRSCRRIESASDPTTSALARQIQRWLEAYHDAPALPDLHLRDRFMAKTILEQRPRGGLTAVWAHNEHIALNPDAFGGPAMGNVLADELGEEYVPLGILCGEGACRAVDPSTGDDGYRAVRLPPALLGSTETALAETSEELILTADFPHPGPRRFIGWSVDTSLFDGDRGDFDLHRPASDFSAIAYLPTSTADTSG